MLLKSIEVWKRLAKSKDIVILRPHKGSSTVIFNRDNYIRKLSDIISDTSKLKNLPDDLTLLREGKLQRFLRKFKNKKYIILSQNLLLFMVLKKIHKLNVQRNNWSFLPIVSSIGT